MTRHQQYGIPRQRRYPKKAILPRGWGRLIGWKPPPTAAHPVRFEWATDVADWPITINIPYQASSPPWYAEFNQGAS